MKKFLLFSALFTLSIFSKLTAQCVLVCNDHVHASMNADDCYRDFIADDFLENPGDCGYEVVLSYPFQVAPCIPPTRANRDLLGYTVVYQVKDPATNNSCWGYVTIEDKPVLSSPAKAPPSVASNLLLSIR
ncbi:MAG: hypothetical protein IPO25_08050 [Saprospiraceae bacterium]|nr:hypothetical protein [Saprospiraceae bacterium]